MNALKVIDRYRKEEWYTRKHDINVQYLYDNFTQARGWVGSLVITCLKGKMISGYLGDMRGSQNINIYVTSFYDPLQHILFLKVAARNCRRRKIDQIKQLEDDVTRIRYKSLTILQNNRKIIFDPNGLA